MAKGHEFERGQTEATMFGLAKAIDVILSRLDAMADHERICATDKGERLASIEGRLLWITSILMAVAVGLIGLAYDVLFRR